MPPQPSHAPGPAPETDSSAQENSERADAAEASAAAELKHSAAERASQSPFAPLSVPVFRMLWITWIVANTCMWMNDVATAWLMTTLTTSPVLVALVQTASTAPVFLLGLPSGALADILDRRKYFMITQFWVAAVAMLLSVAVMSGKMTAHWLLALTFANGIGLAMRWPVFAAIVPELVSRQQLPSALALNGVAMNASRIIGPLLAGAIIASLGSHWVFVLNAALSLAAGFTIMRWRRVHPDNPLGRERLRSAMRVGVTFVRESPAMRAVLWRISIFFFHATALLALLPLVARQLQDGGAGTFTLLLASMGVGAIGSAMFLPRLRQMTTLDQLVRWGTAAQAAATAVIAVAPNVYVAVPAMVVAGSAWITTANSLTVAAQLVLPNWVRARGMSIYQMCIMGATAAGAALWGQIASMLSLHISLGIAAVSGLLVMLFVQRVVRSRQAEEDLSPARTLIRPNASTTPEAGLHLVVTIEYFIDPARAQEFRAVMKESRRTRLQQGALHWELEHDISDPRRYVERILDESWVEHLRRFDRSTNADMALRDRRLAFHIGENPPVVTRYVVEIE